MSNVQFTEPWYAKSQRRKETGFSMSNWLVSAGIAKTVGQAQTILFVFAVVVFVAALVVLWRAGIAGTYVVQPLPETFHGM